MSLTYTELFEERLNRLNQHMDELSQQLDHAGAILNDLDRHFGVEANIDDWEHESIHMGDSSDDDDDDRTLIYSTDRDGMVIDDSDDDDDDVTIVLPWNDPHQTPPPPVVRYGDDYWFDSEDDE